ncbi:MAG TPA: hypothetical protein VD947_03655 [Patescibacteria group bacterium]|nr:hypothetical protein [Patescibacteria group bacterium]
MALETLHLSTAKPTRPKNLAKEMELAKGSRIVGTAQNLLDIVPNGAVRRYFTNELGYCTAVGYTALLKSGERSAFLMHATPFQMKFISEGDGEITIDPELTIEAAAVVMGNGIGGPSRLTSFDGNITRFAQEGPVLNVAKRLGAAIGEENVVITPYDINSSTVENMYARSMAVAIPTHGLGVIEVGGNQVI